MNTGSAQWANRKGNSNPVRMADLTEGMVHELLAT